MYDLSVIIPTFNSASIIERAIHSVLSTLSDFQVEIIVVDDDSHDNTVAQILILQQTLPQLSLVRQSVNQGSGVGRTTGLGLAQGQYVVFLDSDDYYQEDMAVLLSLALEFQPDVLLHRYEIENISGQRQVGLLSRDEQVWRYLSHLSQKIYQLGDIPEVLRLAGYPWNKIISREFAHRIALKFSETYVLNDVYAHYQVLFSSSSIMVSSLAGVVHIYETTGKQLTNIHDQRRMDALSVLDEIDSIFMRNVGLAPYRPYLYAWEDDLFDWMYSNAACDIKTVLARRYFERKNNRVSESLQSVKLKGKRFILYGLGWQMMKVHDLLVAHNTIVGFMDSQLSKAGTSLMGTPIFHPSQPTLPDYDAVVICSSFHQSIVDTLISNGIVCYLSIDDVVSHASL